MRWFVSRNGETQGPFEDSVVAGWVRQGMADASVRDEAGGNWMPVAQSPFGQLLPGSRTKTSPTGFILALFAITAAIYFFSGFPILAVIFFVVFGLVGAVTFSKRR